MSPNHELQLIRDMGTLLADVTGLKTAFESAQTLHSTRHETVVGRLDKIETRLDHHDQEALRTGSHKIITLEAKLDTVDADGRKKTWDVLKIIGGAVVGLLVMYAATKLGLPH